VTSKAYDGAESQHKILKGEAPAVVMMNQQNDKQVLCFPNIAVVRQNVCRVNTTNIDIR
jgi:hypothetical protein